MTQHGTPTLERCVGDVERFAGCWALRPSHHRADPPEAFGDLLSIADIDVLLSEHGLRRPFFRAVGDGATVPAEEYTVRAQVGSRTIDDLADPARLGQLFAEGATIVLQGLHRAWPPLARFCAELSAELGHPTQANAYLSRRERPGFDVHWDTHDVFVLQVEGTKRWRVYEPLRRWPLERSSSAGELREDDLVPQVELDLAPGDCLYLPKGFPHAALATDGSSLHLTIGVASFSGQAILEEVLRSAVDRDDAFRRPLPIGVLDSPDRMAEEVATVVEAFAKHLASSLDISEVAARTAGRLVRSRPTSNRGALAAIVAADAVTLDSRLRLDDAVRTEDANPGGDRRLTLPDRSLGFPARVAPVLEWLVEHRRVLVADLPQLDDESKLVLARRLVAETFAQLDG
ncbi:MAG: Cupin 4 family protein [Acidimicrobiales bacterium]|nr:Cupin 4 family protein [Acidimicrobiales bacterium]